MLFTEHPTTTLPRPRITRTARQGNGGLARAFARAVALVRQAGPLRAWVGLGFAGYALALAVLNLARYGLHR